MMKKNILLSLTALSLLSPIVGTAYAEDVFTTGQVVVSATRTEAFLEDVSASMEVITAEEIKRLGAINVKDALRKAGNLDLTSGRVLIRGMSEKQSLVLVNGRKMAAESRADHSAFNTLDRINVNNIERIEIVRGASSALYGSDAIGGVINIITKKSDQRSVFVGANAGPDELNNYYTFDAGTMGKWDAIFNARFTKVLDEIEYGAQGSNGPRTSFDVDLGYAFNEDHELRLNTDFYHEELERWSSSSSSEIFDGSTKWGTALTYSGSTDKNDFYVTGSWSKLDEDDKTLYTNGTPTLKHDSTYTIYGTDMQNTYALNDMNLITIGAEYKNSNATTRRIADEGVDYYAIFIQDEIALFDEALLITPAVRYDHYSDFGGAVSPKLGVTYKINNNHRLKANYGFGFRAPDIWELHYEGFHSADNPWYGNPDLDAEKSQSWDIRYEGEYKNIYGSITYFGSEVKDQIYWRIVPPEDMRDPSRYNPLTYADREGVEYTYYNIDEVTTSGIEVNLAVDFMKYFTLSGEYYYLDAMDRKKDERLDNRAKHTYVATFMYNDPERGYSATVWSRWVRDMWYDDESFNFSTLNATATKTWKDKYTLYAGIDNILSSEDDDTDNWIDPRTYRVGFEMTF